jgi:small subunit ribosomal protein S20
MPILRNAKKALRVSQRKELVNRELKSRVKTAKDSYVKEPSTDGLSKAFSAIDKAVKGHIFHRNKGARLKSQLTKKLASVA